MKIIVQKVKSEYPAPALSYLLKRLSAFQLIGFPTTDVFDLACKKYAEMEIPVVPTQEFPQLSAVESAAIDQSIACARRDLSANYALLPGEIVESECFSYLSAAFEDLPAGTGLLCQQTNYALVYFFFDNTLIEGSRLRFVPASPVTKSRTPLVKGDILLELALELAKGLLSSVGGEVGALICDVIFDAVGDLAYFQPTQQMLQQIVHTEVTDTVVNQIDGIINGTKNWIRDTYGPEKQAYLQSHDSQLLAGVQTGLNNFSNNLYTTVTGQLMEDQFAKAGFPVFLIGVGVHISLNQELALLDSDPANSHYAQTVSLLAKNYSDFADQTYAAIKQDRQAQIYMRYGKSCSYASSYPVCSEFYYMKDDFNNTYQEFSPGKNETLDDARLRCQAACNAYTQVALAQLNTYLGDPDAVIPNWRTLVTQPLPKTA